MIKISDSARDRLLHLLDKKGEENGYVRVILNGKLVFLENHLDRLFFGAKQLDIDIGYSPK